MNPIPSPVAQDKPRYIYYPNQKLNNLFAQLLQKSKIKKEIKKYNLNNQNFISQTQIQQTLNMIQLDKLTLQVGQKLFNLSTKKFLRIQIDSNFTNKQAFTTVIKTQSPGKVISATTVQWDQTIEIPLILNREIPFEIFQMHEFGYNPQEIASLMHGKIALNERNDKFYNWQVFDQKAKKIGYFSVNVKSRSQKKGFLGQKMSEDKLIQPAFALQNKAIEQDQLLIVSSILANIPSLKSKHGYAVINVGQRTLKTSIVKSKLGELVFVQKYEIQKNPDLKQAIIQIYSCVTDQQDQKIATAQIQLSSKIYRNIRFFDTQNTTKQIGDGFIDAKISIKSQVLTQRIFASIIKQGIKKQFTPIQNIPRDIKSLSRSVLMTNRTLTNSNLSSALPFASSKRFSIVNHNTNIKIPQQKRFFTTDDPANKKCSYLPEQSFEFKQKKVDKYYKGASIGFGNKADFTKVKKEVPSVGRYHLPSIWDRY